MIWRRSASGESIISAKSVSAGLLLSIAFLSGCGPGPRKGADLPIPYDVTVDSYNGGATIKWAINRSDKKPISGYNIYLSEKPLKGLFSKWDKKRPEPYNHGPYPGDTDGDKSRESFEFTHLENGRTYYVSVRTVGISGEESRASAEVEFVPLSKGVFTISSNHSSENGGFNFEGGISTPARDPRCDVYLYAKRDVVGLSSPGRLSAGLRNTAFSKGGSGFEETIVIRRDDRLVVKTDDGSARIRIVRINHEGTEAEAVIEYVFYPKGYNE